MKHNVHPMVKVNALLTSVFFLNLPLVVLCAPYSWLKSCYAMILVFFTAVVAIDMLFSDSTNVNLRKVRREKFSMPVVVLYGLINMCAFSLPFFLLKPVFDAYYPRSETLDTHELAQGPLPSWATMIATSWSFGVSHLTLKNVALGALLTVSTDYPFYLAHKYMHRVIPKLHVLHHCCSRSSTSTNLIFNPVDLLIEFSFPVAYMFAVAFFIIQDFWVFAVASCVATWWYSASHEEFLAFPHTLHHTHCNSMYFAYIPWWYDERRGDAVNTLVDLQSSPLN